MEDRPKGLTQLAECLLANIKNVKGRSTISQEEMISNDWVRANVGDVKRTTGKDERGCR